MLRRNTNSGIATLPNTAVVIPMISLEACNDEGEKVTKKNKKQVNSMYWCVQGTR